MTAAFVSLPESSILCIGGAFTNLEDAGDERQVHLANVPSYFPAARRRKNEGRRLETDVAVPGRDPGSQWWRRPIDLMAVDRESTGNASLPPELHRKGAIGQHDSGTTGPENDSSRRPHQRNGQLTVTIETGGDFARRASIRYMGAPLGK
jgi:hypothetical protein